MVAITINLTNEQLEDVNRLWLHFRDNDITAYDKEGGTEVYHLLIEDMLSDALFYWNDAHPSPNFDDEGNLLEGPPLKCENCQQ